MGKDFFGKLVQLQIQDRDFTPQTAIQKQWYMLRGQVDKITITPYQINIQDVLKIPPKLIVTFLDAIVNQPLSSSHRVVVEGPPGIGKTTLCHKLLDMAESQYIVKLYCPLGNDKIAQAGEVVDLFVCRSSKVLEIAKQMIASEGEKVLLIFDGWDELSTDLRQSSLAAKIIRGEILPKSSVIVTSRTYASFSLLEIPSITRCEVMGFLWGEIEAVIKATLEKEALLAEKLIQDLELRDDVQSLCYVPIICSIVISVYCELGGQLPTTLTELYDNFILQTIRRHVETESNLHSLHHLPPNSDTLFKKICEFAYLSLKENNPRTFSSDKLHQSLHLSVEEGYLGLITPFTISDWNIYQFLDLSIQEFLAAWWITKYKKTEEVFAEHFDNDHFRMCLRFVAGLTHLDHESYQQYFNKELDLQCKRRPLFGFDKCYYSHFNQIRKIHMNHQSLQCYEKLDILLLQLLYESQNTKLCQIFSQSVKNQSLCLRYIDRHTFSLFDIQCLGYFLNNSNTIWNHLDLGLLNGQAIHLLTKTLTSNNVTCLKLELMLWNYDDVSKEAMTTLLQSSFCSNLQELYVTLEINSKKIWDLYVNITQLLLLELIQRKEIKVLCFTIDFYNDRPGTQYAQIDKITVPEVEDTLWINVILHESQRLEVAHSHIVQSLSADIADVVSSLITIITEDKYIRDHSYLRTVDFLSQLVNPVNNKKIEQLFKEENNMLQALKLNVISNYHPISSLDLVKENTPLTALEIGKQMLLLPQQIKGLNCVILHQPHPLPPLFQCHSNLQQLQLSPDTAESVIELFTILQSNTTLKALRVKIDKDNIFKNMGPSLQDMLAQNKTIEYLEIIIYHCEINSINPTSYFTWFHAIPSTYLSFLTTGLSHNTSLQELSVPIPLSNTNCEQLTTFFNTINPHLTELELQFRLDKSCASNDHSDEKLMMELFYEQGLPLITNMLKSHTSMKLLHIECSSIHLNLPQPNWIKETQQLCQTIFRHPTLQYVRIIGCKSLLDVLKSEEKTSTNKEQLPLIEGLFC